MPRVKPRVPIFQRSSRSPFRDAVGYWLFAEGVGDRTVNLTGGDGDAGVGADLAWVASPTGPALRGGGTDAATINCGPLGTILDDAMPGLTMAVRYTPRNFDGGTNFGKWGGYERRFLLQPQTDGHLVGAIQGEGGVFAGATQGTAPLALGQTSTLVLTWETTSTIAIRVDNRLQTINYFIGGSVTSLTPSADPFWFGSTTGEYSPLRGDIHAAAIFTRALSDAEHRALHDDWSSGAFAAARPSRHSLAIPASLGGGGGGPVLPIFQNTYRRRRGA